MPLGEMIYLSGVIAAFVFFGATLLWAERVAGHQVESR